MEKKHILIVHIIATVVAMVTICSFFTASLYAELLGDDALILAIKRVIFYCLPLMLFAMPTLAFTGNMLAGKSKSPQVSVKQRRMKIVAVNGVFLIALATLLFWRARSGRIDTVFLLLQCVELLLGAANLVLLGLNIRVGRRLAGKTKRASAQSILFR